MDYTPEFYNEAWSGGWDDMKLYGPTARHTRRLVLKLMKGLAFSSVLDAGCGTGVLLQKIKEAYAHVKLAGFEYSPQGLEFARKRLPDGEFCTLSLSESHLDQKFDLVTCIDVLEHIPDDMVALGNLLSMTGKYMILSVPIGPLFAVEAERFGHVHGYSRAELEAKLRRAGFKIQKKIQWGFPFYNLHRRFVNRMPAKTTLGGFSSGKRMVSELLNVLFYLNIAPGGERYYVLCSPGDPA